MNIFADWTDKTQICGMKLAGTINFIAERSISFVAMTQVAAAKWVRKWDRRTLEDTKSNRRVNARK
jgi:hypothetical protein